MVGLDEEENWWWSLATEYLIVVVAQLSFESIFRGVKGVERSVCWLKRKKPPKLQGPARGTSEVWVFEHVWGLWGLERACWTGVCSYPLRVDSYLVPCHNRTKCAAISECQGANSLVLWEMSGRYPPTFPS